LAPLRNLAYIYSQLGQFDKGVENDREALRLDPLSGLDYTNLVSYYTAFS
jgi:tetratricopeptide (TPR) repeat protein